MSYPKGYFFVGLCGNGDTYALDTARQVQDGDCPVVRISHEGPTLQEEWLGIPEFLEDVIAAWEACQADPANDDDIDPV